MIIQRQLILCNMKIGMEYNRLFFDMENLCPECLIARLKIKTSVCRSCSISERQSDVLRGSFH